MRLIATAWLPKIKEFGRHLIKWQINEKKIDQKEKNEWG
jgi:hypothetical protein